MDKNLKDWYAQGGHMAGGGIAKITKATGKAASRAELQAKAKALGLPAGRPNKDIQRMLDIVEADPKTWTEDDYKFIRPQLAIHQDLRPGSGERVESIMSEGLKRGMVDYPESMESPGYSFSKRLESPDSYLFLRGGLKFKEPTSPWLAEGNMPMFRISPTEGQSLYEAIVSSAVKNEPKKTKGLTKAKASKATTIWKTPDGYTFYELPNGKVVDNLNPDAVDMSWPNTKEFMSDMEGTAFRAGDELGERRSTIESFGRPDPENIPESTAATFDPNDPEAAYQRALNQQRQEREIKPALSVIPGGKPPDIEQASGGLIRMAKAATKAGQKVLPKAQREANLEKFLEKSKVKGRVYHGTQRAPGEGIEKFEIAPGMHTGYAETGDRPFAAWFSTDPQEANRYAEMISARELGEVVGNPTVYPSYLQLKNPANSDQSIPGLKDLIGKDYVNFEDDPYDPMVVSALKSLGYDGIVGTYKGYENKPIYISFNPKQIKSATGNVGTYDPEIEDISRAGGGIVKVTRASAKAAQGLGKKTAEINLSGGPKTPRDKAIVTAFQDSKERYLKPSVEKGVVYHGTKGDITAFRKTLTPDDHVPGISVTDDPDLASSYAESKGEGANVMPLYVQVKKPINYPQLEDWALSKALEKGMKVDPEEFAAFDIPPETLVKWLKEDGYDAIDYRSDPMLGYGLRVFEPEQLKSATGMQGHFDPTEKEINKAEGGEVRMKAGGGEEEIRRQLAAGVPVQMAPGQQGDIARDIVAKEEAERLRQEEERRAKVANLPLKERLKGGYEAARTVQSIVGQELAKPIVGLFGGEKKIRELEEGMPLPESEAGIEYLTRFGEFLSPVAAAIEKSKIPDVPFLPELGPVSYIPGIGRQVTNISTKAAKKIDEAVPQQLKDIPVGMSIKPVGPEGEKLTVNQLIAKLEAGEELTPEQRQKAEYSKAQKEKYAQANIARQAKEPSPKEEKVKVEADDLGFYSPVEKALANSARQEGSGQDFINDIMKFNPSSGELEGTGVIDWLKTQDKVTKQDVQDYLDGNKVQIKETVRGTILSLEEREKLRELERAISKGWYDIPQEDLDWYEATKAKLQEFKEPKYEREGLMLPGGKNYREIVLSLPTGPRETKFEVFDPRTQKAVPFETKEEAMAFAKQDPTQSSVVAEVDVSKPSYISSHFPEPNILAHMRTQDMTLGGKRTLVVEEIQSDWHQAGREKGYVPKDISKVELEAIVNTSADKPYYEIRTKQGQFVANIVDVPVEKGNEASAIEKGYGFLRDRGILGAPPDAPFKKDWYQLAIKRLMKYAADNDYDQIALVGPEEQIRRGSLGTYVDGLTFEKNKDGTIKLLAEKGESVMLDKTVKPEDLELYVGKNVAKKILSSKDIDGTLTGDDLMIGGEGMRQYYGRTYPDSINRIGKKYNANIEKQKFVLREFGPNDVETIPSGEYDRYGREILTFGIRDPETEEFVAFDYDFEKVLKEANKKAPSTSMWVMDLPKKLKEDVKIGQSYKKGGAVKKDTALQEWHMAGGGIRKVSKAAGKGAEKASKRMSREEAEAAGYWHPISETKLAKPISEYKPVVVEDPSVSMTPKKTITLEDLQGGVAIPLAGDRAAAGRIIKEIEGTPMNVALEGGPDFMRLHPGAAWASGKGVLSMLADRIRMARESGNPIYGVYTAMSPQAVDFNTMMTESILNQLDISGFSKKDIKEFNQAVKSVKGQGGKPKAPNFPGVEDPELREKLIAGPGGQRDAFIKAMAKAEFQKKGFPDVAAARIAVTDPELLDIERGSSGYTIAQLDPEARIVEQSGHTTYPLDLLGEYAGGLEKQLPVDVMYPTHFEAKRLLGKTPEGAHKSLELFAPLQYFDQSWLDNAMMYLEKQKKLTGRKKGGLARAKN